MLPVVQLSEHDAARQAQLAAHYHIVNHGKWGFEVQPPQHGKAVLFNAHKRDAQRNWHDALAYAQKQPWAAPLPDETPIDQLVTRAHLEYLDDLRGSGVTNMYGATPYLIETFALAQSEARRILAYWMQTYSARHPREAGDDGH